MKSMMELPKRDLGEGGGGEDGKQEYSVDHVLIWPFVEIASPNVPVFTVFFKFMLYNFLCRGVIFYIKC